MDAAIKLEDIHTNGESDTVSSLVTEIMNSVYGTSSPTPAATKSPTDSSIIRDVKNQVLGTTDMVTDTASNVIDNVFNP